MNRVTKTSPIEQSMNSRMLDIFMYSFIEPSLDGLKDALHDDGSFVGFSKDHFIAKVQKLFYSLDKHRIKRVIVNRGICLDTIPGADVLELRFASEDYEFDEFGSSPKKLGDKAGGDEVVLRFAFHFDEGKIKKVSRTRRFIDGLNFKAESILDNKN